MKSPSGNRAWEFIKERAWYIILLVASSSYVWHYRFEIYQLKELNARNLIFILWLLLLFWPLISEMEFLGVKVKKEVEKATGEVKESLAELRMQITNLQIANSIHTQIYVSPWKALLSEEEMDKSKQYVGSSKDGANNPIDSKYNTLEQFSYFLEVISDLRKYLFEICAKLGYENDQEIEKTLTFLRKTSLLDSKILKIVAQIYEIAKRGINREIVSKEYVEFVEETFPSVLEKLKSVNQSMCHYCVCPHCKYTGYSNFENVCPICGFIHDDD